MTTTAVLLRAPKWTESGSRRLGEPPIIAEGARWRRRGCASRANNPTAEAAATSKRDVAKDGEP